MKTTRGNEIIRLIGRRSNVYLIRHRTAGKLIVDTGVRASRKKLINAIKNNGAMRAAYLILTHSHFDHVANASYLCEKTQANVVIHKAEAGFLRKGSMCIPAGTYALTRALVKLANAVHIKLGVEPCFVDIEFGDSLLLPNFTGIELIHTPGHSPGSSSLIIDNEIALVGDTMINATLFKVFPPFADDTNLLKQSWNRLLSTGCTTFLPSHGKAISRQELLDYMQKNA